MITKEIKAKIEELSKEELDIFEQILDAKGTEGQNLQILCILLKAPNDSIKKIREILRMNKEAQQNEAH
jgi:hypothetical protein